MNGVDSWPMPCTACGHHAHPGRPCQVGGCDCLQYQNEALWLAMKRHYDQALLRSQRYWRHR